MRIGGQELGAIVVLLALSVLGGCSFPAKITTQDRLEHGLVLILPGIEGASVLNTNIAKGLSDGGVPSAIEVYDWTAGSVVLFPVTLRALDRNRSQAAKIAAKIMAYQDAHPGKPVHLIGHSGGGGVAVLTLEALPPDRKIASAILLAPAIAPDYDLRKALRRTQYGIWNFWSPYDVGFLKAGTTVMGTIDGRHTSAAGATGFVTPWGLDDEDRRLYGALLHQQRYTQKMAEYGHTGGHIGWANRRFVASWLAPIISSQREHAAALEYAADAPGIRVTPKLPADTAR